MAALSGKKYLLIEHVSSSKHSPHICMYIVYVHIWLLYAFHGLNIHNFFLFRVLKAELLRQKINTSMQFIRVNGFPFPAIFFKILIRFYS